MGFEGERKQSTDLGMGTENMEISQMGDGGSVKIKDKGKEVFQGIRRGRFAGLDPANRERHLPKDERKVVRILQN